MSSTPSDSDLLLQQAAGGNVQAKEQLLIYHRSRLRRMIEVRMDPSLKNRIDPSDIVQETLMLADQRLARYLRERPIPFYPWLRQLAWDQLVMIHRKHLYAGSRSRRREMDVGGKLSDESAAELASCLIDRASDPLSQLIRTELGERVRCTMDRLPETYRDILVLRHLEQLSTAETAEVLGIGQSAAKMRHLRAVERLRDLLEEFNDESLS